MNICGHLIADDQVIGIGPLLIKKSDDPTVRSFFNEQQLSFSVYLKHLAINIESDFLPIGNGEPFSEKISEARQAFKKFEEDYSHIKDVISEKIKFSMPEHLGPA